MFATPAKHFFWVKTLNDKRAFHKNYECYKVASINLVGDLKLSCDSYGKYKLLKDCYHIFYTETLNFALGFLNIDIITFLRFEISVA